MRGMVFLRMSPNCFFWFSHICSHRMLMYMYTETNINMCTHAYIDLNTDRYTWNQIVWVCYYHSTMPLFKQFSDIFLWQCCQHLCFTFGLGINVKYYINICFSSNIHTLCIFLTAVNLGMEYESFGQCSTGEIICYFLDKTFKCWCSSHWISFPGRMLTW